MAYIVSIDQSTSGTKGLVWNGDGTLLGRADVPHRQITNDKGWVSHDLNEIYSNSIKAVKLAIEKAGIDPDDVCVLGISNQRETAAAWNRKTGEPFCDAVVWQCSRAAQLIHEIEYPGLKDDVLKTTGLYLSPYFSAAKFAWILRNCSEAAAAQSRGDFCCGTIDSWLVYRFTGGKSFKTDYSNASRTQLLDLNTLQWSRPLMELFGIEPDSLPQICFSDSCFGQTSLDGLFKKPIPIHGVLGDSHAALFANRCLEPFSAKATYGTGSSVMMNCGKNRPTPKEGIVTSLAWGMQGSVDYVLEGNINYTGAVIKWLAEEMELISSPKEAAILAASVNDNGGVYLVPAFSGLGAPWFRDSVRAAVIGLNRSSRKAHLVRAAEECIAYQIRDVTEIIKASISRPFSSLRLDGGPTADQFLMQFQADILGMDLFINNTAELSGAGAAYCAAAGIGIASAETLFKHGSFRAVHPAMDEIQREKLYQGWKKAVASVASSD